MDLGGGGGRRKCLWADQGSIKSRDTCPADSWGCGVAQVASQHVPAPSWQGEPSPDTAEPGWGLPAAEGKI